MNTGGEEEQVKKEREEGGGIGKEGEGVREREFLFITLILLFSYHQVHSFL